MDDRTDVSRLGDATEQLTLRAEAVRGDGEGDERHLDRSDDVAAGPPYRLRSLRGRELALALSVFALAVVPFVVALVRAFHDQWVPSGDEANIATRSLDVFSRHPPLTGLPSTSFFYGERIFTHHPGPIEFYVLAIPLRVLGATTGPLLTAAAINGAFVLTALWVCFRRGGLAVLLWASVVLQLVMWSAGTSVLTDTLSSNMTLYPVLGTAVIMWGVADGDIRLLPGAAIAASYAAQQHLAGTFVVASLTVVALVLLVVGLVRRSSADPTRVERARPWVIGAVAVFVVCWTPVIIDQVKGQPGNLTQMWDYARDNDRRSLGFDVGVRQLVHAIVPPNVLTHTDTNGAYFVGQVWTVRIVGLVAVGLALVATAWWARRRAPSLARLAVVTIVMLAAGLYTGSNFPLGIEITRVNLYRWTWTAAFLTWTTLGWALAVFARDLVRASATTRTRRGVSLARIAPVAPVALAVVAALIATSTVVVRGPDDTNREEKAFRPERAAARAVLDAVDHDQPVYVLVSGHAGLDMGAHLIFRLVEAGVSVKVRPDIAVFLGRHRATGRNDAPQVLVARSGSPPLRPLPGKIVYEKVFDPRYTAVVDQLTAQVRTRTIELTPQGNAIIDRAYPGDARLFIEPIFEQIKTDPRVVVRQPGFLKLVLDGAIASPKLDRATVRRLLELSPHARTVLGAETIQVSLLTRAEYRQYLAERR